MPADMARLGLDPAPSLRDLARKASAANPSTPDVIANALREAIVSGALAGGEQLRQSEVAAEFGVSIIPVREAMRQLVAEGFVVLQRNRGAIVTEISIDELTELFDLRLALESILLGHAVRHLGPGELEQAAAYQQAFDAEQDTHKWGYWNWLFHETLYQPAARPRTLAIVANVNQHIDRLLRLQMTLVDGKRKSRREHGAILAACRRGDATKAVSLLQQHISGVRAIILAFATQQASGREASGR
jgi:DNA-binding GntR family transcriptional regulator